MIEEIDTAIAGLIRRLYGAESVEAVELAEAIERLSRARYSIAMVGVTAYRGESCDATN